ncbi:hypothetical protein ES703_02977 [subsurface metagenome]
MRGGINNKKKSEVKNDSRHLPGSSPFYLSRRSVARIHEGE